MTQCSVSHLINLLMILNVMHYCLLIIISSTASVDALYSYLIFFYWEYPRYVEIVCRTLHENILSMRLFERTSGKRLNSFTHSRELWDIYAHYKFIFVLDMEVSYLFSDKMSHTHSTFKFQLV